MSTEPKAERTPGPWVIGAENPVTQTICFGSRVVANVPRTAPRVAQGVANAEYIVRACNAHDDMLEALESVIPFLNATGVVGGQTLAVLCEKAIAKATGKGVRDENRQ